MGAGYKAVLVLLGLSGCFTPGDGGDRPRVAFHSVELVEIPTPGGASSCPVTSGAMAALAAVPLDDHGPGLDLHLAVGCMPTRDGAGEEVHAAAEIALEREDGPKKVFQGFAVDVCHACARGKDGFFAAVQTGRVVLDAIEGAMDVLSVLDMRDDEILRILRAPGSFSRSVVLQAIGEAGERRIAEAVEPLLDLLDSDDRDVLLRVIGALGLIGDHAAVKPLGRMALSPLPEVPHVALAVLADLGGADVVRTLEFVVDQATDPLIRKEASRLLKDVKEEGNK